MTGPTLFWDLSNLDGAGSSVTGTPFASDNVKISPSGTGVGTGTCNVIKCTANQICADAYQHPDDTATKVRCTSSFILSVRFLNIKLSCIYSPAHPTQEP